LQTPTGANYPVTVGDGVRAEYTDEADAAGGKNVVRVATAVVSTTTGTLAFDKSGYDTTDTATITLTDPDANTNPSAVEVLSTITPAPGGGITIQSTSDPVGFVVPTTETGINTGVFTAMVSFSPAASSGTTLRAVSGDTITAIYRDWSPAGVSAGQLASQGSASGATEDVSITASIGVPPPTIPASTTGTETLSATGTAKTSFSGGETLLASSTVMNQYGTARSYLVAIQMLAPDGTVYPSMYISVELAGLQEFTFSPSFVLPTDAMSGTWTFEVSVFDTFPAQGGTVQADPATQTFTVS
jgi:hypothetical protein